MLEGSRCSVEISVLESVPNSTVVDGAIATAGVKWDAFKSLIKERSYYGGWSHQGLRTATGNTRYMHGAARFVALLTRQWEKLPRDPYRLSAPATLDLSWARPAATAFNPATATAIAAATTAASCHVSTARGTERKARV